MGGKKKGGLGGGGGGGGGRGIAKHRGGGGFQQDGTAKAVRRACEQDDVYAALACDDPQMFGHDVTTVSMLLNLLLRKGRLAEAIGLLGHRNCTALPFAKTIQALDGLTQTVRLEEEAAVALVAAAVTNAGLNSAERAAASFFVAQAGYVVLEFVAEGIAAHDAIETKPLDVLRRMGRAAVVRCAPGKKKGEVLCAHEGGGGFNGSAAHERSVQGGDCVRVAPLEGGGGPGGGYGGLTGGGGVGGYPPPVAEAEVCMAMPLVLKLPTSDAANKLCGGERVFRLDRMANRIAFSRQLNALAAGSECRPLGRAPAGLLRLLRARLPALGSSTRCNVAKSSSPSQGQPRPTGLPPAPAAHPLGSGVSPKGSALWVPLREPSSRRGCQREAAKAAWCVPTVATATAVDPCRRCGWSSRRRPRGTGRPTAMGTLSRQLSYSIRRDASPRSRALARKSSSPRPTSQRSSRAARAALAPPSCAPPRSAWWRPRAPPPPPHRCSRSSARCGRAPRPRPRPSPIASPNPEPPSRAGARVQPQREPDGGGGRGRDTHTHAGPGSAGHG